MKYCIITDKYVYGNFYSCLQPYDDKVDINEFQGHMKLDFNVCNKDQVA